MVAPCPCPFSEQTGWGITTPGAAGRIRRATPAGLGVPEALHQPLDKSCARRSDGAKDGRDEAPALAEPPRATAGRGAEDQIHSEV